MKWTSAITVARSVSQAVEELEKSVRKTLPGKIDLVFFFVSPYFRKDYDALPEQISERLGCTTLIGCSAGGVIGGAREIEKYPALSVLAASLPEVTLYPFHRDHSDLPDLDASPKQWENCFALPSAGFSSMVLLADPFTLDVDMVLQGLDYAYPNTTKVGGLASGREGPGQGALFLNHQRFRSGVVGVGCSGKIVMDTVVAHGCRPVGKSFSVTRCDRNLLIEMDHKNSMDVLKDLFSELSENDQKQIQHSVFIGFPTTPFQESSQGNDVLIRPLIGFDSKTGALAVGALPREGQRGQFYLRNKEASVEDLKWTLANYQLDKGSPQAFGALLFACTGRGAHFYGEPDLDTQIFHSIMGPHVPLGGFFCNGEIGALNKTTYLHGYTSCFGIFREPS